ncbi:MAG TPA: DUF4350 domain-containing protein, partial [Actinomycetota bacterium]|nr:DUF4350 domain-containing protein [Actinomycetota bacterium]
MVKDRRIRWVVGMVLVVALVVLAILVVVGTVGRQQADDPRSSIPGGAGALGALLAAEGVLVTTTNQLDAAAAAAGPARTLVVANAHELEPATARPLLTAGWGKVILLRPYTDALTAFGVRASRRVPVSGSLAPDCPVEAAQRAGTITVTGPPASYVATGPAEFACYPTANGHVYLGANTADGVPVELVGGGVTNSELSADGNAAFALNVFGTHAEITWLMARADPPSGTTRTPTLLPPWWSIALAQCAVAFAVVAIWRGRRLGPILSEPLPVRIRAAETVEGHGRLYHRLAARDRAAEALRAGSIARLSRAFGRAEDPAALSEAVATRTGRDPADVRRLLFEAVPGSDDDL